jgi:hypothetical protein
MVRAVTVSAAVGDGSMTLMERFDDGGRNGAPLGRLIAVVFRPGSIARLIAAASSIARAHRVTEGVVASADFVG